MTDYTMIAHMPKYGDQLDKLALQETENERDFWRGEHNLVQERVSHMVGVLRNNNIVTIVDAHGLSVTVQKVQKDETDD